MSYDKKDKNEVETTGHEWDGIEELNNPLPKWWVYIFYATIVWGIGYTIAYPAWPMIKEATPGLLGYSTRANVAEDIAEVEASNSELVAQLETIELASLPDNEELHGFAVNGGAAVYRANCSQCHGSGAAGVQAAGYPNLLDDDWLWGGAIEEIAYTVEHGIRNEQSFDARWSQMPAFGADEILNDEEIEQVVAYAMSLSDPESDGTTVAGHEYETALAAAGEELYLGQCSACHLEDGTGDQFQGAPNLTDAIWLYGGSQERITETVTYSRFGVMPAWSDDYRSAGGLTRAEINMVAAYVHQLGGGE